MVKKLLLVSFVLMLNFSVPAQGHDLNIWAGGEFIDDVWHDTMIVMPGEWFSVTIYMQTPNPGDSISAMHFPLGIRYAYIDSFYTETLSELPYYPDPPYVLYPPFGGEAGPDQWDIAVFGGTNDDILDPGEFYCNPPGYKSLSFWGNARGISPPPPPYPPPFNSLIPVPCFTFYVHASDTVMPGQTICDALIDGFHPAGGVSAATFDGIPFNISIENACVYFDNLPGYGTVTGTVTDIMTDTPIENVHVSVIDNTSRDIIGETWTDPEGGYAVALIPFGYYDLQFEHSDYVDSVQTQFGINHNLNTLDMEMYSIAEEDVVFWYGRPGNSPIIAFVGELLSIDVYIQTAETAFGADVHIPLGVQDQYFNGLLSESEGQYYYPFTAWDAAYFDVPCGSPPNPEGWSSQSFFAQMSVSGGPWLNYATPAKAVTFVASVADDPSLIGETAQCISIGVHPDGRPLSVGDTLTGDYYPSVEYVSEVFFADIRSAYLPGDMNMALGLWPPTVMGGDKTYLIGYFIGMSSNQPCFLNGFWASADVTGDCQVIGGDATRLLCYFIGGDCEIEYCPDYEPLWLTPDDIPEEAPSGWPFCE